MKIWHVNKNILHISYKIKVTDLQNYNLSDNRHWLRNHIILYNKL